MGTPRQLELWEETWSQAPRQLSIWPQMRVRQPLVPPRQAKCQRVRYRSDAQVELIRSSSGRWRLRYVIACGRWTCPVCGRRRAQQTSGLLGACFARHRETRPNGDQWMLTLTPVHRAGDELAEVVRWQYEASARLWRSKEWRALAAEFGIEAKVRVLDATHGGRNGTHPHHHVALFVREALVPLRLLVRHQWDDQRSEFRRERARRRQARQALEPRSTELRRAQEADQLWELEEGERLAGLLAFVEVMETGDDDTRVRLRDQTKGVRSAFLARLASRLLPAWRRELAAVGCPYPPNAHAVDLAPSERAEAYYLKWGLAEEVGLPTGKDRNHLRLLDVVLAGLGVQSDVAGDLYRAFVGATKGRAWVTGLADACRLLGIDESDGEAYVAQQRARADRERERAGLAPRPEVAELHLVVRPKLWSAFLALGHERVFGELDERAAAAAAAGVAGAELLELVQRELDGALSAERERYFRRGDTS